MKKLIISILAFMIILTACTGGAALEEEETAVPATEVTLEEAPTETAEPTEDIPTATPTAEPEPTETAEPTPTAAETAEPTEERPQEEAPTGTLPDEIVFPEEAVIIFTRTGGFAGFDDTWVFYADGRTTLNGEPQAQLTPERINGVVTELDNLGFFQIDHLTKPGEFCCDFFDYTLAVQAQGQQNFVSFTDGNPNLPQALNETLSLMIGLVNEAQEL